MKDTVLGSERVARAQDFAQVVRAIGPYRWVGLYDATPTDVWLLAYSGDAPPAHPRFARSAGLSGAAIAGAAPVVSNDVASDSRYLTAFASTGSELIIPLCDERGRVVGTVDIESPRRDAFTPTDIEHLVKLAATAAPLFTHVDLRTAVPDDGEAVAGIYASFVVDSHVSFEDVPPSTEEMRRRIVTTLQWTPWLCALNCGDVLGYAYAAPHRERAAYRWSVDVAAYVTERFIGRGVGRTLYARLLDIVTGQGFRRAYGGVALPNDGSVGLHRAFGFEEIGVYRRVGFKLGRWHDVAWFGRCLGSDDDMERALPEPIPFPSYVAPPSDERRRPGGRTAKRLA